MTGGERISSRPYAAADRAACLRLFETNAPDHFAPAELDDYSAFLRSVPAYYQVCTRDGDIVGAYGLDVGSDARGRLRWIMTKRAARGSGLGRYMMRAVIEQGLAAGIEVIDIAASQKSAPFFARFGAVERRLTREGWGPGLDRVDMELRLAATAAQKL